MGDFNQILFAWLGEFPKGRIPMEESARIYALKDLFGRFKQQGFEKSFFTNTIKAKITTVCINPNHPDKKKRRNWAEYVTLHMDIALHSVFQEAVAQEENPLASPVVQDAANTPDIEDLVAKHETSIKKEKKEKFVHTADTMTNRADLGAHKNETVMDPEMAKLLGIHVK